MKRIFLATLIPVFLGCVLGQHAEVSNDDGNLLLIPAAGGSVRVEGELFIDGSKSASQASVALRLSELAAKVSVLEAQLASCACSTLSSFNSTWDTTRTSAGSSSSTQIRLPLEASGTYAFLVRWGDDSQDFITAHDDPAVTHTYGQAGSYTVLIDGTIHGWRFDNDGDKEKLSVVWQWGSLRLGNNGAYFRGTGNMAILATDLLDLTGTTNMESAFHSSGIASTGNLDSWDVSQVTTMFRMFYFASSFDQSLNRWNVSKVNTMEDMFAFASSFNHPLDNWKTTSVTTIKQLFFFAPNFNQPLNSWDVSQVTDMKGTFHTASSFDRPLNNWDVGNVETMETMFYSAISFDQPLSNWNTSSVTTMSQMFYTASQFNQPLLSWDVSKVENMFQMFSVASAFNQDLSSWCVTNISLAPSSFDASANQWVQARPVWGTCPS